ncbi:sugar ABC transporter permease [Rathayibacter toxicus]|nr:sugar ABC transporter permease [Rathayibacter toxicus]
MHSRIRGSRDTVFLLLGILLLIIFCVAPFYWMIVSSLKPSSAIFNNDIWPTELSLENYAALFTETNRFGLALRNSVIVAGMTTVIAMVVGVFSAYAIVRLRFPGKKILLAAILAASMFPGAAILTPLFQLFASIGWINTFPAMIVPDISFALPLGIWTLTSFFREMPWELEQAAMIDGASQARAFRSIILPLAAPGVFTTSLLVFTAAWNEYLIASKVSITANTNPVTVSIAKFSGSSQFDQPFGTQMAAGVIATIPLIILVLMFQRRIVAGLTAGGVK